MRAAAALLCAASATGMTQLRMAQQQPDVPAKKVLEGWNSRKLRRLAESMGMSDEEDDRMSGRRDLRAWIEEHRPTPAPPPPKIDLPSKQTLLGWHTRQLRELAEKMGLTEDEDERMTSRRHYRAWIEARRPLQIPSDDALARMSKRRLAALASELGMSADQEEGMQSRRDYLQWIKNMRLTPVPPQRAKGQEFWDTDCRGEDLYIGGLYQKQCGMTFKECSNLCLDAAESGCNAFVHNYEPGEGPNPQKRRDGCCWLKSGCTEKKTHRGKRAVVLNAVTVKLGEDLWDTDCRKEDLYVDGAYQKFCDTSFADCRAKCQALPTCGAVVHNYGSSDGGTSSMWQDGCCWLKTGCRGQQQMLGKRAIVIRDLPQVTPQPPPPWTPYPPYTTPGSYEAGFEAGRKASYTDPAAPSLRGAPHSDTTSSSSSHRSSSHSSHSRSAPSPHSESRYLK